VIGGQVLDASALLADLLLQRVNPDVDVALL
jgi:hypothetical protein